MGTVASEDFYTGTAAGLAGGTTMIIDFVIPDPEAARCWKLTRTWRGWAEKVGRRTTASTSRSRGGTKRVHRDMGTLVHDHGVNSFKHFMAYKNAIMADDEMLVNSFTRALELGAHADRACGKWRAGLFSCRRNCLRSGITGPEAHPLSRPPEVEGEAANRAITHRRGARRADVHRAYLLQAMRSMPSRAPAAKGQRVFGEVLAGHLVIDDSVYRDRGLDPCRRRT